MRCAVPAVPNRWVILCVLFLARTAMSLQFQTVASTGSVMIDTFAIDFAALGLLIGIYMLPGVAIALPGGVLGQRFGAKRIVMAGLALMAIGGAVMAAGTSYAAMMTGRLISGTGAVFLTVMVAKMTTDWFAGRQIVAAMSTVIASWPFGLAIGLVTYGPLAQAYGWTTVMLIGVVASVLGLVLIAAIYRDPPGLPVAPVARLTIGLTRREWILVLIAGAIWGLFNVGYIVLISFAPEVFTARGYSPAQASTIVSFVGWALIPTMPLTGLIVDRVGRSAAFMLVGFVVAAIAACAVPFVSMPLVPFTVLVIAIGVPAGLIMSLPAQVLRAERRASGLGVFFTCYFVAMALLPGAAGLARDISGSPASPALFAAGMMVLCMLALMLFHAAKRMPEQ